MFYIFIIIFLINCLPFILWRRKVMNFDELKEVIVDTLGCDEDKVTENASLMEDLEADSLDIVELHMALEEKTGITIPDEELAKLSTVKDILSYMTAHAA
jgi:acyl carrier protein